MHGMYSVFIWYLSVDVSVRFLFLFFFPPVLTSYMREKTCSKTFFFLKLLTNVKSQQRSCRPLSTSLGLYSFLFFQTLTTFFFVVYLKDFYFVHLAKFG